MGNQVLFIIKNLYTMERLGVMQMSAVARLKGWNTDLAITDSMTYDAILKKIRATNPKILAFSAMSPEYSALEHLAERLRRDTGLFVLFGGPHPTFFPEIIQKPFIQAISVGEGDISFAQFLEHFPDEDALGATTGMHFHLNGKSQANPPAPLVADLDQLPFPDRELMIKGDPLLAHNRTHIFMASRGCPNACTYCFNHKYNQIFRGCGQILRRRSVENLLSEMEYVRNGFGMEFAYIDDDIFTLCPIEWLEQFAAEYPRRVGVPFMCNVHVNFVDEEKIRCLKDAGCQFICFGIECGDEVVANSILKRRVQNERIIWLSDTLRQNRIRFMTQNILALPLPHPLETDLHTLDLNIRCRPDYAVAHIFFPLPGTELEQYSRDKGFFQACPEDLPERTNSYSALEFPDPREKIKVQRLHKLFGLTVSFPFLRRMLPLLIRLPLTAVYSLFFVIWYGYSMRFRLEQTRKSPKEITFFLKSLVRSFKSFLRRQKSHQAAN